MAWKLVHDLKRTGFMLKKLQVIIQMQGCSESALCSTAKPPVSYIKEREMIP